MITFNPTLQTTALGSFTLESDGVVCGTAYPDPSSRFRLAGGWLSSDELLPMWGGVAISENTPAYAPAAPNPPAYPPPGTPPVLGPPRPELGGRIRRATSDDDITGFSVFDQNHSMLNFPGSPVPQSGPGMQVNFYRFGSQARIALPINPALLYEDAIITGTGGFQWNYDLQWVDAWGGGLPVRVLRTFPGNCLAPVFDGGPTATPPAPGHLTWNPNAAAAIVLI
jgi:hypothetical protein